MTFTRPWGAGDDWPGFQVDAQTYASLAPLLEEFGIVDSKTLDAGTSAERYRGAVVCTGFPFLMLPLVTAWGEDRIDHLNPLTEHVERLKHLSLLTRPRDPPGP